MAYVKHNFSTGDTLYASQLNEMDTQILANETAAANAKSVANTAKTTADSAKSAADAAKTAADAAKSAADNALPLNGGVINGTLAVNGGIFSSADIIDNGQLVTKKYVDSVTQNSASTIEPAEDDIPKVFIDGTIPTTKDDVLAELTYISKSETFHAYIKIKCQGSSSMDYPKKNFTVKLYSDEARETDLPKLFKDWSVESSKFVLKANYIDHSHARNIISAKLWDEVVSSRADYDTLPAELRNSPRNGAIDGFPIKVYTNGTYQGVYTWNIGKDAWMWGMDEDNANHVLLCNEENSNGEEVDTPSNFRALWTDSTSWYWSVEVGEKTTAIVNSLNALISCVKDTDDATFKATIGSYLDVQSAIDYWIHQYVICGIDGLGKNLLLATYDGTKWICGAYDMDSTFGLHWGGTYFVSSSFRCPEDYQEHRSLLWERISTLFADEVLARYTELRNTVYSYSNLFTHFERFMDVIGLDLYAEDLKIYSEIPSGSTNNIQQIRNFAKERLYYCDVKFGLIEEPEAEKTILATNFEAENTNTQFEIYNGPIDWNTQELVFEMSKSSNSEGENGSAAIMFGERSDANGYNDLIQLNKNADEWGEAFGFYMETMSYNGGWGNSNLGNTSSLVTDWYNFTAKVNKDGIYLNGNLLGANASTPGVYNVVLSKILASDTLFIGKMSSGTNSIILFKSIYLQPYMSV